MDPLIATHPATGQPLVNPAIATAAIAACLGAPGPARGADLRELALIVEAEAATLDALPPNATLGHAVIAATGEIIPPGQPLPPGRLLFAALRIALPADSTEAVLDTLRRLAGSGWRFVLQPRLEMALDRSLAVLRARPADLAVIPGVQPGSDGAASHCDGAGVLLGVVDFGCDFAHPAFRTPDGATRLDLLWDQNAPTANRTAGPLPGTTHDRAALDAALAAPDPYAALGYRPDANAYAPAMALAQVGTQAGLVHGTHVLGVAAGRATDGCPPGVAPAAALAFVHLRPGALVSNGDPADVFDAVCAIFAHAAATGRPAVVNLSLGANTGSHDGNTLYDRALDAVLAAPGRAIAVSAGNERQARLNMDGAVTAGSPTTLAWCFAAGDPTPNTLRIFCDAPGPILPLTCTVRLAGTTLSQPIQPGANAQLLQRDGVTLGVLYAGLATTCDPVPLQQIEIRMHPSGQAELVEVELSTAAPDPVPFDAWIDRDDRAAASQSSFGGQGPSSTRTTLASTACGRRTTCVGAFDHGHAALPAAPFSAEGTTRDRRPKPDVSAPGLQVFAAAAYGGRTPPGQTWRNPGGVRMSGTSVAAPHVAGVLALMLQQNPALDGPAATAILRRTAHAGPSSQVPPGWDAQLGDGRVDAAAAIRAARETAPKAAS